MTFNELTDELNSKFESLQQENKELNEYIKHIKELSNYHERKKLEYKEKLFEI